MQNQSQKIEFVRVVRRPVSAVRMPGPAQPSCRFCGEDCGGLCG